MTVVEIWFDGQVCDLGEDTRITHTFKVNDIADLKDRQAAHTNLFDLPKTARNVRIMQGLGIASDTSRMPYRKPNCQVKISGFDLIVKGWANVTETADTYKLYVYSGVISFFKAIENKTLKDLGNMFFNPLNHAKSIDAVIASFTNEYYRYFVADYNGKLLTGDGAINVDHLIPSVRAKYIFEAINSAAGYSFDGKIFSDPDYTDLWLTNSKFSDFFANSLEVFSATGKSFIARSSRDPQNVIWCWLEYEDDRKLTYGSLAEFTNMGWKQQQWGWYIFPEKSKYKVEISGSIVGYNKKLPVDVLLAYNSRGKSPSGAYHDGGVKIGTGNGSAVFNYTETREFNEGDSFAVVAQLLLDSNSEMMLSATAKDVKVKVTKVSDEQISFSDSIADVKQTDFVKEVLNRFGLTAFPSEFSSLVSYRTVQERTNAPATDWSAKYVERTSETYIYDDYAQKNVFSWKYSDENLSYYDGSIEIDNKNLPATKNVFKSMTFAPENGLTQLNIGTAGNVAVPVLKMYEKEPDDKKGVVSIKYKGLDKRFFLIKEKKHQTTAKLGSETLGTSKDFTGLLPVAVFQTFTEIIAAYYSELAKILNDSRLHTITLDLNLADILSLDFFRLYYFRQEQQYYILNKLTTSAEKHSAEFVRVQKQLAATYRPAITWEDGTAENRTGTLASVKILDNAVGVRTWLVQLAGEDVKEFLPNGNTFPANVGNNAYAIRQMINGSEVYSNTLYYTRQAGGGTTDPPTDPTNPGSAKCRRYYVSLYANMGDSLEVSYTDCKGNPQNEAYYAQGVYSMLSTSICAIEDSLITNGVFVDEGPC